MGRIFTEHLQVNMLHLLIGLLSFCTAPLGDALLQALHWQLDAYAMSGCSRLIIEAHNTCLCRSMQP